MVLTLAQLSRDLASAQANMQRDGAARVQDSERRMALGVLPWLADFFGLTAAADQQRASAGQWNAVKKQAAEVALAWVGARTVFLSAACTADVEFEAYWQHRAEFFDRKQQELKRLVDLVDAAARDARGAQNDLEAAASQRNLAAWTGHRGFVMTSNMRAGLARSAVGRAQRSLELLQNELPKLRLELKISIPGAVLELLCYADGGAGSKFVALLRANQLRSAASHCKRAAAALDAISRELGPELSRLQAEHNAAVRSLDEHRAPYRRQAFSELPSNLQALLRQEY